MTPMATSTPNIAWLDEELRKEKAIVSELRDTIDRQQVSLADQTQRILALEDRLTKLQGQLARVSEVEESLRHTRDELVLMISELRQDQQKRVTETMRNRLAEREQDLRSIQQMEAQLQRFEPLEQGMVVRQAEERRLNEMILRIQQSLEDTAKRLSQRDEVGRQLADRIEQTWTRVSQVETAVDEGDKKGQEQMSRLLLLESTWPRFEQKIADLETVRDQLTKEQDEMMELERRADRERSQTLTEWGRRLEAYAHQLDVWAEQIRYFNDQNEKNRRVLREVQELAHQVSQQQDQMRQLQRIAEEQLRREFAEWRNAGDHRWAQEAERREAALGAQATVDGTQDKRLVDLEEKRVADVAALNAAVEHMNDIQAEARAAFERARQAHLRVIGMEAKATQEVLAELQGLLGEEGK
jgi:uncharacterized phage infection (PIP) family protein YhgE